MKINEVVKPGWKATPEERRQHAIKAIQNNHKRGFIGRATATRQLAAKDFGDKQIQALLGPESPKTNETWFRGPESVLSKEERRQHAIKAIINNYRRDLIARHDAVKHLTDKGLDSKQIETMLGSHVGWPEKNESDEEGGHDVISSTRLMRIIMHLTQLMYNWRADGQDQPANDLRSVLQQHGLMEAAILSPATDNHYKKIKAGQIAKIDKQIADATKALKTNKHVASRASMVRNVEDLEGEKDRISKHYKDKHGIEESTITRRSLRGDAQRSIIAQKAIDLQPHLDKIRDEKNFEAKKLLALDMAQAFTAGGREKFLVSIQRARTPNEIDAIAYNAEMKGKGMGVGRF